MPDLIRFHNTLTGRPEDFKPLQDGKVLMYACGPTVYDYAHIGNFRTFVFEDLLRRFLESEGFEVRHVMNVTDVDDKTIAGARREGKNLGQFTKFYQRAFDEDSETLNILPPTIQPKATEEIAGMTALIQALIRKGAAYESDGSVYYRVAFFERYGDLSKKDLKKNIKGARVDVDEYAKEEGADFVLWKKAKGDEPSWDSPWGKGRPGWHIECSVMSMRHLGETIDIHAGGEDLIFPHHENEIAQSEAATGKPFVRYWLHAKHLLVDGEKMSKSKGNFYTLRDLLEKGHDPMAIRYVLLSVHYRSPLNFTLEGLKSAKSTLNSVEIFYQNVKQHEGLRRPFADENMLEESVGELGRTVRDALADDLDVAKALAAFHTFAGETEPKIKKGKISRRDRGKLLRFLDIFFKDILGLRIDKPIPEKALTLKKERELYRKKKDFSLADQKRKEIEAAGCTIWDEPTGESGIARL